MMSESRGRAVVIAPSALGSKDLPAALGSKDLPAALGSKDLPAALGSKDLPAGLSKVPPRESARRYIRRRGSVSGMWRRGVRGEALDMTISRVPRAWSPGRKSGGQKGFRHVL